MPADVTLTIETTGAVSLRQIGLPNTWLAPNESSSDVAAPAAARTRLEDGQPMEQRFTVAERGVLTGLRLNDIRAGAEPPSASSLTVDIADAGGRALARCAFQGPFPADGAPLYCPIAAVSLDADREYVLRLHVTGGALLSAGAAIANEGHWDDAVPLPLPSLDPWKALYQIYPLEMAMEDDGNKQRRMQYVLDHSQYIVVSSNRFYGSLPRNPRRWPMSIAYYRGLFSGELGFELIADFGSYPTLGPWWRDDQSAEEAFTVYDHPRVFVFRKSATYDPSRTADILGHPTVARPERRPAAQVTDPPADIELPALPLPR